MPGALRCSIVINTYNRAPYLEKLLLAFNRLTYDDFEVIVVNGPSTDWTAALLREYRGRIKVIDCPEANLSLSRNLGIAAAAGDIVVFIDDDALPDDPAWLDKMVEGFKRDREGKIAGIGGAALIGDTHDYQFQGGASSDYARQVFREEEMEGRVPDGKHWVRGTVGCNSAFRRSALEEIGGFDEHFIYYLDETDVCLRLARKGYDIVYLDDCIVRHYMALSPHGSAMLRNRRLVTRSDTYYCLKNGGDGLLRRVLKTLWLAPQKHFVREIPALRKSGRISRADVIKFLWNWLRGLVSGMFIGLFTRRRNRLSALPPPDFIPFRKDILTGKLRICLLSQFVPPDRNIGGIARYTWDLAHGLHELGHEVHVITKSDQAVRYENLEFVVHGIPPGSWSPAGLFPDHATLSHVTGYSLAVFDKLMDLASDGILFDVVETPNWDVEGLTTVLSQVYPTALRIHSPLAEVCETEQWEINKDLQTCIAAEKWLIQNADAVTASTQGVMESCLARMGIDVEKLAGFRKVPLGLKQARHWEPTKSRSKKRLLYVGRFEYRKGTDILLAVLPELLDRFDDWECFLVGANTSAQATEWMHDFENEYTHAAWRSRMHVTGTVDDETLQRFYQTCDLFVAPSIYESFGLVYLEAMQYGKPVVGCRTGGIPEVVTHGRDGFLVEPGDETSLLNALSRLMSDRDLREEMGRQGRERVERELNHMTMAHGMVALYKEAMRNAKGRNRREVNVIVPLIRKEQIDVRGKWLYRKDAGGSAHLFSNRANESLSFFGEGGSTLAIVTSRLEGGGVLAVDLGSEPTVYVDLFWDDYDPEYTITLKVPGSSKDNVPVKLSVHPERNPRSKSTEVWLSRVLLTTEHGREVS